MAGNKMKNLKNRSLGDKIFDNLLDRIQSGEFAPGYALNESLLAKEFGTSRGPIREALRRLQGIRLVSRESFLKTRVTKISAQGIDELFQMREALEGYACRLAAKNMTTEEINSLKKELKLADSEPLNSLKVNVPDFHYKIVISSRNSRIIEALCGDLYHLLHIYRRWAGETVGRHPQAHKEHWEILRAIELRDQYLSESLMRSHIARARELLNVTPTNS